MSYTKQLGIFVRDPQPGTVKTRLVPPLTSEEACNLYAAFVADLLKRVYKMKRVRTTVFYHGDRSDRLVSMVPDRFAIEPQHGETLGKRLVNALEQLLGNDATRLAVIIGSDSPDIPLAYLKRAYAKLKHRDVVLGPSSDGGYYLVGARGRVPAIFDGISWGSKSVLADTLDRIAASSLRSDVLPLWYDVDTEHSLDLLAQMVRARRMARSDRLLATERALAAIGRLGGE